MSSSNYTLTPNLGLFRPNYDMDDGLWGTHLNANADVLDNAIYTLQVMAAASGESGVVVDSGVDPLGPYNQPARVHASTLAGAGAGPRLPMTTLGFNSLYGYFAGNMLGAGSAENTFLGYAAGMNQPSGNYNTYVGNGAGWGCNYDSSYSTFVGMDVFRGAGEFGFFNAGTFNVGVGTQCFRNGTFNQNVAIGTGAMRFTNNTATTVTCNDNVAIGYSAMTGDGTAIGTLNFNVAVGWSAGSSLGVGQSGVVQGNTLLGHASGRFLQSGSYNTLVGYNSGGSAAIGGMSFDTFVGAQTAQNLTTGTQLTGVGFQTGTNITSGNANDMFGYQAGLGLTTGSRNSIFGGSSAVGLQTGTLNTILGPLCASSMLVSGNNNILIGYGLDTLAANTGSTINIGNAFVASAAGGPANNGHITLAGADVAFANALFSITGTGVSIDVPNQLVTGIVVAAAGSGYLVNDTLNDASGGRYNVATVSGTGVATLTIIKPGVAASPPSNPVTLTNGSRTITSNQQGTGCTATLTWSARNALLLNKSANDVLVSNAALATSAVVGFLGLPACTGTPTGVPTNAAAGPMLIYNKATNSINVYTGAGWQHVTLTAGAA